MDEPVQSPSIVRRLKAHRWVLAASIFLMALYWLNGALSLASAVAGACVMTLAAMLAPVQFRTRKKLASAEPIDVSAKVYDALNDVPEPIALLALDGTIVFANIAFEKIFGRTDSGTSLMLKFRSSELQGLVEAASKGQDAEPVEFRWTDAEERWFACSVQNSDGGNRLLIHFRDMTEAKYVDRIRSDFIANASHELRTPLASMTGFIETLAGPARDDAKARDKFLDIMQQQAERMSRLIDDLLTLSRFETARGRANYGPVDIMGVLEHVIDALRPMARSQNTDIQIVELGALPQGASVNGSRDELIQLFENLIENALKYGSKNGKVDVELDANLDTSKLRIGVRDDGPGIESEHLPRLVERFYRVDVDTSRNKQGTGLGLSIVKHIAQRHNAILKIHSEVGRGTVFNVTLGFSTVDKTQ